MLREFNYCRKRNCFIHVILDKQPVAVWPLHTERETRSGAFVWKFYIRWTDSSGSHITRELCEKHHKQLVQVWSAETQSSLDEEEATERWLSKTNSQMYC